MPDPISSNTAAALAAVVPAVTLLRCNPRLFRLCLPFRVTSPKAPGGGSNRSGAVVDRGEYPYHDVRCFLDRFKSIDRVSGELALSIPIRLSVGIAEVSSDTRDFLDVIQTADARMYQDKARSAHA